MKGFVIKTEGAAIRFAYYAADAPHTCAAFHACLPFSRVFFHARVSGQEFWTDKGLHLNIAQENASVFTLPGEAVLGPLKPARAKTADALGIYYGEGHGLDSANIFARAYSEDLPALAALGERIWKKGETELLFEPID